jgi:hypothetical protein
MKVEQSKCISHVSFALEICHLPLKFDGSFQHYGNINKFAVVHACLYKETDITFFLKKVTFSMYILVSVSPCAARFWKCVALLECKCRSPFEASSWTLLFVIHFIHKAIRSLYVDVHSICVLSDLNANLHIQPWLQSWGKHYCIHIQK